MTPTRTRLYHASIAASIVAVLGLAALMEVETETTVGLPGLGTLPPLCWSQALAGVPCPGCGLTRSFICCAHGELGRAFGFNLMGPLLFGLALLALPPRLLAISERSRPAFDRARPLLERGLGAVVVMGVLLWPLRLAITALSDSP